MSNEISNAHNYQEFLDSDLQMAKESFKEILNSLNGSKYVIERLTFLVESLQSSLPNSKRSFQTMACCMKYSEYLQTYHWHNVREKVLERYGNSCSFCCSQERLEVHHRTYKKLGREQWGDVILLCHECHDLFHQHRNAECQLSALKTREEVEKENMTKQTTSERKKRNGIAKNYTNDWNSKSNKDEV